MSQIVIGYFYIILIKLYLILSSFSIVQLIKKYILYCGNIGGLLEAEYYRRQINTGLISQFIRSYVKKEGFNNI